MRRFIVSPTDIHAYEPNAGNAIQFENAKCTISWQTHRSVTVTPPAGGGGEGGGGGVGTLGGVPVPALKGGGGGERTASTLWVSMHATRATAKIDSTRIVVLVTSPYACYY